MVSAQVNRLLASGGGYTYQQIYQAIWYLITVEETPVQNLDKYGIGLLTYDEKKMQEALRYMQELKSTRDAAAQSARNVKEIETKKVAIKRQKRNLKREEFVWDEE